MYSGVGGYYGVLYKCNEIIFPEITYKTPNNFFCDASGLTYLGELNDFT